MTRTECIANRLNIRIEIQKDLKNREKSNEMKFNRKKHKFLYLGLENCQVKDRQEWLKNCVYRQGLGVLVHSLIRMRGVM